MSTAPELLPLPSATFHILVALADDEQHGYAIMQDVAARTGGELKLSAGTLYRSIQRMLEQGLIVENGASAPRRSSTTNGVGTIASPRSDGPSRKRTRGAWRRC